MCPLCRHPLSWSGACYACHGCTTGQREDRVYPGDQYELTHNHWRLVAAGPAKAETAEQNIEALHIVQAVHVGRISTEDGQAQISRLFGERER